MDFAEKIAGHGPSGMELTKQLIYRGLHEVNIATQVEREDAALVRGFKTEDYQEGQRRPSGSAYTPAGAPTFCLT